MSSLAKIVLGTLATAGLVGAVAYAASSSGEGGGGGGPGSSVPAIRPGYSVAAGCKGITITDAGKATEYAREKGSKAAKFSQASGSEWTNQLGAALGFPTCASTASTELPVESLAAFYTLVRAYFSGAVGSEVITPSLAETILNMMRSLFVSRGVPATDLPQGLPPTNAGPAGKKGS
jgi:hypothetical protein